MGMIEFGPFGRRGALPIVHFVRHGQSTWNLRQLVQGQQTEPALTSFGRLQARGAASALTDVRARRLLTSDLIRAAQTAEIIGRAIALPPTATTLLREQGLGDLEGLTTREATDRLLDVDLSHPDLRYAGGESRSDVATRIATLVGSPLVTDLSANDDLVVVSHGDTIRIAISYLLDEGPLDTPWRTIGNGAVVSIDPIRRRIIPTGATASGPAVSTARRDR